MWCDVRLTKDGGGICLPSIDMDNCTTIANFFPQGKKTYNVNGVSTVGWFSVDYTSTDLLNVSRKWSYKFVFPIVLSILILLTVMVFLLYTQRNMFRCLMSVH
jgi:hypothetical protein